MLDRGARQVSDPTQCHAVAVDGRAPRFDGGIVTRVDCVPLGIVVNQEGRRFYDEGEDFWPKRYAIWGRLVAQQPGQIGHVIIDQKAIGKFMPPVFPAVQADTIRGLAGKVAPQVPIPEDDKTLVRINAGVHIAAGLALATGRAARLSSAALAATVLPTTMAALGLIADEEARPEALRGEGVLPVATAAVRAVNHPGTELGATEVAGARRGVRGMWVELRHRRREPATEGEAPAVDEA